MICATAMLAVVRDVGAVITFSIHTILLYVFSNRSTSSHSDPSAAWMMSMILLMPGTRPVVNDRPKNHTSSIIREVNHVGSKRPARSPLHTHAGPLSYPSRHFFPCNPRARSTIPSIKIPQHRSHSVNSKPPVEVSSAAFRGWDSGGNGLPRPYTRKAPYGRWGRASRHRPITLLDHRGAAFREDTAAAICGLLLLQAIGLLNPRDHPFQY